MKPKMKVELGALAPPFLDKKTNTQRYVKVIHDGFFMAAYEGIGSYRLYYTNGTKVRAPRPPYAFPTRQLSSHNIL